MPIFLPFRNLLFGKNQKDFLYDKFTRRGDLLRFTKDDGRLTGMPVFSLVYPCMTLAQKIDPLLISSEFEQSNPTSFYVILKVREKIKELLNQANVLVHEKREGREDDRWYWAALALLDKYFFVSQKYVSRYILNKNANSCLAGDTNL